MAPSRAPRTLAPNAAVLALVLAVGAPGCLLDYTEAIPCETSEQCPTGFSCNTGTAQCIEGEFEDSFLNNNSANAGTNNASNNTNNGNNTAVNNSTVNNVVDPGAPCLPGMVHITTAPGLDPYCIDRYEASRPDASANGAGSDTARAVSRPNTVPWTNVSATDALRACSAAGKRLCTLDEWGAACGGSSQMRFPYANDYVQGICNTFGSLAPSARYAGCELLEYSTFDMSGNAAELIDMGGAQGVIGGSYNDTVGDVLACDATPGAATVDITVGFRCCAAPL